MTISDVAAKVSLPALQNAHNVLIYDLERVPGRARHQHRGLTIEGDFWDLNSWKHTLGYRLPADSVIEWPRTICAAWRWYGKPKVHFAAEWQPGGHQGMLAKLWEAHDKAQITIGHNIKGFDERKLLTDWLLYGLPRPSPSKPFDTLTEARKLGFESNTLASLTDRLGIETKTDKYDVETARAAVSGDRAAQRKIRAYNEGDIDASTALYDALRHYSSTHPHSLVGTVDDRPTCHACWSDNLERNGTKLASLITYVLYRCLDCGANVQGSRHSRAAVTRGAR
jgi:hypothetical protein